MKKTLLFFMAVFMLSSCATKQNPQEDKVKTNSASNTSINKIDKVVEIDEGIKIVKFYKNNQPTGTWQYFIGNGLWVETIYENGKPHKRITYDLELGKPWSEIHFVNGKEVSDKTYYYDNNGKVSSIYEQEKVDNFYIFTFRNYKNGRVVDVNVRYGMCEEKGYPCEYFEPEK